MKASLTVERSQVARATSGVVFTITVAVDSISGRLLRAWMDQLVAIVAVLVLVPPVAVSVLSNRRAVQRDDLASNTAVTGAEGQPHEHDCRCLDGGRRAMKARSAVRAGDGGTGSHKKDRAV
jgi:hypothetical protein